jgi:hypothetical protein
MSDRIESIDIAPETQDAETRLVDEKEEGTFTSERLAAEAVENLQMFERERVQTLHYGTQYELLPHILCYQCGKVIGNKWFPYLEYLREKLYKPEEVIDLLPLTEDQRSELLEDLATSSVQFQEKLLEYGVKSDFDLLYKERKYTPPQIYEKLQLRNACCRMNFLNPIHVPLKRDAFEQPSKSKQILNPLSEMDVNTVEVIKPTSRSPSKMQEGPSVTLPLIPSILSTTTEEDLGGSCKQETIRQMTSFKTTVVIPEEIPDDFLDQESGGIQAVGDAVQKRRTMIPVGEGYEVPVNPIKYRAR